LSYAHHIKYNSPKTKNSKEKRSSALAAPLQLSFK